MSGIPARHVPGANGERPLVGVADADPAVREGVCALLESCGLPALSYGDAGALLAGGAESLPACLVLDLDLPGLTRPEAFGRIRSLAPETRVIVMIACPDPAATFEVLRAGASAVLEKPFPPDRLVETVERILARSGSSRSGPPAS